MINDMSLEGTIDEIKHLNVKNKTELSEERFNLILNDVLAYSKGEYKENNVYEMMTEPTKTYYLLFKKGLSSIEVAKEMEIKTSNAKNKKINIKNILKNYLIMIENFNKYLKEENLDHTTINLIYDQLNKQKKGLGQSSFLSILNYIKPISHGT